MEQDKTLTIVEGKTAEECRRLSEQEYVKSEKLRLFLPQTCNLEGKITNKIKENQTSVVLVRRIQPRTGRKEQLPQPRNVFFFDDEKIDSRRYEVLAKAALDINLYSFFSGSSEYVLATPENLKLDRYMVSGAMVKCPDSRALGETWRLDTELRMIFPNKIEEKVVQFKDIADFEDYLITKSYRWEDFRDFFWYYHEKNRPELDGVYRFPQLMEQLILAFTLSGKHKGYPLHLLLWGNPAVGKSQILKCLNHKFGETVAISNGAGSTLKSLIPSFKGTIPQPGNLATANRMCIMDEFLHIPTRTGITDLSRDDLWAGLNILLEHSESEFRSGNCAGTYRMTARCLFATNPTSIYGSISQLFRTNNAPFFSRMLVFPIFGETEKEMRLHITTKNAVLKREPRFDPDVFLSIVDYLQSFNSEFDEEKVNVIFSETKDVLPDTFEGYTRYLHHAKCLMDGITKTRCLAEGDMSFVASHEDYKVLNTLWQEMVNGWVITWDKTGRN